MLFRSPTNYKITHIYHNLQNEDDSTQEIEAAISDFYSEKPLDFMEFGEPDIKNERIYTVKIFGIPKYQSSITIVHTFFGVFKVTSMLTNFVDK